jgi:molybdate transport system regulatory protein
MNDPTPGAARFRVHLGGFRAAHRIWLQDQGEAVFGIGVCELLARVETTGSLRQGAAEMVMAYSKAWRILRRAEEHLGCRLVTRHAGGRGGGCSILTEEGRSMVEAFSAMTREADAFVDELFARHFGDSSAGNGKDLAAPEAFHVGGD